MTETPTSQQTTILSNARTSADNLIINALAGAGKSTTLRMIERAVDAKPCLYLAFNRRVVDAIEFKARAEDGDRRMSSTTSVRTFNSLGHRIWAQAQNKRLTLNAKKVPDLLRQIIEETPRKHQAPMWESFWPIVQGVAVAKAVGYVPDGKFPSARRLCDSAAFQEGLEEAPDDLTGDLIDATLTRSITAAYAGNIDFNDQVYMPALFGGVYPKFPIALVDEAQDLNPVNHEMVRHLKGSRIVIVGDPWQSIYGFRGAVQSGMAVLKQQHGCSDLDLSVSFRCPSAIVSNVRWRVPHFRWIKEGGHVSTLDEATAGTFPDGCAILCRNNAPLFRLAMQLLAAGRSVQVAGSDIGPKLVAIMRKLGPEEASPAQVRAAIDGWLEERLARGNAAAQDLADCMKVFAAHGDCLGQAIRYAEHLFAQRGTLQMMTIHKAKGLEWDTVFHLDPWLCRTDEQDLNLRYVCDTRSKDTLHYINSDRIRW